MIITENERKAAKGWKMTTYDATRLASLSSSPPGTNAADEAAPMTREERCAILCALVKADDRNDALALARLGWMLFDLLCRAQQAQCEAVETLQDLRIAARAVVMGDGNRTSVTKLADLLVQHGWLPRADPSAA